MHRHPRSLVAVGPALALAGCDVFSPRPCVERRVSRLQRCGVGDYWSPELRGVGELRVLDPHPRTSGDAPVRGAAATLAREEA